MLPRCCFVAYCCLGTRYQTLAFAPVLNLLLQVLRVTLYAIYMYINLYHYPVLLLNSKNDDLYQAYMYQ